jgi:DNA-binding IclR family transcriptional regulator
MTTLSSAADVLRCFSADRPDITVTQVSRMLAMPKSNASRLLRAMAACGMLESVGDSKRYRPGLLLHDAGRHYRLTSVFVHRVEDAAARAARRLGQGASVFVAERDRRDVVNVSKVGAEGVHSRYLPAPRGCVFASAAGAALLARLDQAQLRAQFAPDEGAASVVDLAGAELARRRGFATYRRAAGEAMVEIAVAVGEAGGRKEAALVTLVSSSLTDAQQAEVARALHDEAAVLAQAARDPEFRAFVPDAA